jgi:hypothetical protein
MSVTSIGNTKIKRKKKLSLPPHDPEDTDRTMPVLGLQRRLEGALELLGWQNPYGEGNLIYRLTEFSNKATLERLGVIIHPLKMGVDPTETINSCHEMSARTRMVYEALIPRADCYQSAPLIWAERVVDDDMPEDFCWGDTFNQKIDVVSLRFHGMTLSVRLYPFSQTDINELDAAREAAEARDGFPKRFDQLPTERLHKWLAAKRAKLISTQREIEWMQYDIESCERSITEIEARLKERGELPVS